MRIQAELISPEQVNKVETFSQDYQSFLRQKNAFEDALKSKNQEFVQKQKDLEQAQALLKSKTVQYDELSSKFEAQEQELVEVKGISEDSTYRTQHPTP